MTFRTRLRDRRRRQAPVWSAAILTSLLAPLVVVMASLGARDEAHLSPAQIAEKEHHVSRVDDSTSTGTFTLINAAGQKRVRQVRSLTKLQPNGLDNMRLIRFLSPADVKGTGVLLMEQPAGDDDMWVYLPALKKVRRLVATQKKESFVGTDFSYGDILGYKLGDWTYALLGEETVDGQPCHVLEAVASKPQVQEQYGYSRRVAWIRKDTFVTLRAEHFDVAGQLLKRYAAHRVELVDAKRQKWQPMTVEMVNVQTGHQTVLDYDTYQVNLGVPSRVFSPRYLEREV